MFNTLKVVFQTAPVLCHFDSDKPIRLKVDASEFAITEILACEDSNLHAVQAGNLGAAMAGSLPSCL